MAKSNLNLQPNILEDELTKLIPLEEKHFEALYDVASDPLIWEQHPMKDRYKREVFRLFFDAALNSKGSFLMLDQKNDEIIGSTRFYNYDAEQSSVAIGFTFIARKYWGTPYNNSCKKLLIDYAFQNVNSIFFHVGAENIRSQKAVLKLGATKVKEMFTLHNEVEVLHFEYELKKEKE